jgi:hypothetical protein
VKHADELYTWSRRILGPIPSLFMRYTFFAHFCAGEDQEVRCYVPFSALSFCVRQRQAAPHLVFAVVAASSCESTPLSPRFI